MTDEPFRPARGPILWWLRATGFGGPATEHGWTVIDDAQASAMLIRKSER